MMSEEENQELGSTRQTPAALEVKEDKTAVTEEKKHEAGSVEQAPDLEAAEAESLVYVSELPGGSVEAHPRRGDGTPQKSCTNGRVRTRSKAVGSKSGGAAGRVLPGGSYTDPPWWPGLKRRSDSSFANRSHLPSWYPSIPLEDITCIREYANRNFQPAATARQRWEGGGRKALNGYTHENTCSVPGGGAEERMEPETIPFVPKFQAAVETPWGSARPLRAVKHLRMVRIEPLALMYLWERCHV